MFNQSAQDYLKAIYELGEHSERVTTKAIAEKLGVSSPSVTAMARKLAGKKLLVHKPYYGVKLTKAGKKVALEMIRHHRLIELYLQEALGMPWDKVHEEAEKWEHFISEEIEDRMEKKLGFPKVDPHGAQIPTREGVLPIKRKCESLNTLESGTRGIVAEVSDHDSELLNYLGSINIFPESRIEVKEVGPFDGPMTINVNGRKHVIGKNIAMYVSITDIEGRDGAPDAERKR